jgi:hypothetical protein
METKENQLMVQQPTAPVVFNFFDPAQFDTMQRVCKMFANSELVPDMYKATDKNPENKAIANCMIAISMAMRVGADPLMIMQNMVIIYGRPSWSSKFLVATVNTCGRFNPLQYRFTEKGMLGKVEYTEYTKTWMQGVNGGKGYYKNEAKTSIFDGTKVMDIECVAFTTAKGSDKVLESSPITVRMAVQEGWYTKNGSKWQTMTKQMLMYRAASFWTNAYAPELSMGMKTEDEVRDIVDVDFVDVTEVVEREKAENANKKPIGFDPKEDPKPEPDPQPATPTKEPEQGAPAPDAASEAPTPGQDGLFGNKPGF